MELGFFRAAHVMLWFASIANTVLKIDWCCSYCWTVLTQVQGFLFSPCYPRDNKLDVDKSLGGWARSRTADPPCPRRCPILYHHTQVTQCERKRWGGFGFQVAVAQRLARLHSAFGRCQCCPFLWVLFFCFFYLLRFVSIYNFSSVCFLYFLVWGERVCNCITAS